MRVLVARGALPAQFLAEQCKSSVEPWYTQTMKAKKTSKAKKSPPPKKQTNIGVELQETIVEASELATEIDKMNAKLETLKGAIRDHALSLLGDDQNSLTVDTKLGKCTIAKVKDAFVLSPGFEAAVLKKTMPKALWDTFFMMVPQLRGTAGDAFLRLNEKQRRELGDPTPFEFKERQAQVRLPK